MAWRFLIFQKESRLVRWFRERTADRRKTTRTRPSVLTRPHTSSRDGVLEPKGHGVLDCPLKPGDDR
jgi:hypothetical protein